VIAIDNVVIVLPESEIFVDLGFGIEEQTYYKAYDRVAGGFVQHYANRSTSSNVMFRME